MEKVNEPLMTTPEVLERLRRLGLDVSDKQITNDTADRFLPPRLLGPVREGRGRTGLWKPWMVRRAERLYRLRRRKDADGRPMAYGDTLRILLFVRDGWGWSTGIRDLCLTAYEKCLAANLAPVRRYARGPADREKVEFALEAHDVNLLPAERYASGVAAFGQPLDGGSLKGVFRAAQSLGLADFPPWFVKMLEPLGIHDSLDLAMIFSAPIGAAVKTLKVLLKNLTDQDAQRGIAAFMRFITHLRAGIHRAAIAEGHKGHPTNPLTFFGFTQRHLEREFRTMKMPQRVTPAQWLALTIGISIVSDQVMQLSERAASFALSVARRIGMEPPRQEERMAPFAFEIVRRVFGINPITTKSTTTK